MSYTVEFRKEAQQDILEAVAWYEEIRKGLGSEFLIAIENEKHFIEENPYYHEDKYKGIRKAVTKHFPYILYYRIESNNYVMIYAVLHMKRNPKVWKRRAE